MMENTKPTIDVLKAHLALNVRDASRSVEFYRKMLGIEPSKTRAGYAKFDVSNPPLNLTLNQASFSERGALSHMGIQVASTDDVMEMRQRWIESGLVTRDEMQTTCCYALQNKAWVQDPDGNAWEVFVVLKDNLQQAVSCSGTDVVEDDRKPVMASGLTNSPATAQTASCCGSVMS